MRRRFTTRSLFLLLALCVPLLASAQEFIPSPSDVIVPDQGGLVPCGQEKPCTIQELITLGVNIFNWLLAIGGAAALLALIVAGIKYFTAATQGGDVQEAKASVRNAVIGLVVLLAAVVLVRTVTFILRLQKGSLPEAGQVGDLVP